MFTKEELKQMKLGLELSIKKKEDMYAERADRAEALDWDISQAERNSIDSISKKIHDLRLLRKKISDELTKM